MLLRNGVLCHCGMYVLMDVCINGCMYNVSSWLVDVGGESNAQRWGRIAICCDFDSGSRVSFMSRARHAFYRTRDDETLGEHEGSLQLYHSGRTRPAPGAVARWERYREATEQETHT